jgi:hypothetical protein
MPVLRIQAAAVAQSLTNQSSSCKPDQKGVRIGLVPTWMPARQKGTLSPRFHRAVLLVLLGTGLVLDHKATISKSCKVEQRSNEREVLLVICFVESGQLYDTTLPLQTLQLTKIINTLALQFSDQWYCRGKEVASMSLV